MDPRRSKIVKGYRVEEFWWAGEYVVYINHALTEESFDQAVTRLEGAES